MANIIYGIWTYVMAIGLMAGGIVSFSYGLADKDAGVPAVLTGQLMIILAATGIVCRMMVTS